MENATRTAWIRASDEILEELQKDWSQPVQAHATQNADGSWEMTFRTYRHPNRLVSAAQRVMRQSDVMANRDGTLWLNVTLEDVRELREVLNALKDA